MITVEKFNELSGGDRNFRSSIKSVDSILKSYLDAIEAIGKRNNAPLDLTNALTLVAKLTNSCTAYQGKHQTGNRVGGVTLLLQVASLETEVMQLLRTVQRVNDPSVMRLLMQAKQLLVDGEARLPPKTGNLSWLHSLIGFLRNNKGGLIGDRYTTDAAVQGMVLEDVDILKNIASSDNAPAIVRSVLKEITSAAVAGQMSPQVCMPGVSLNETVGSDKKYALAHRLVYDGGAKMRLGAIVHELTHIAVSEAFGHSAIMLAIPRGATDEDFLRLSRERRQKLESIKILAQNDSDLKSGLFEDGAVAGRIIGQCDYALENKVQNTYLKGKLRRTLDATETPEWIAQIERIAGVGKVGSDIVEYDSVINQILIWCHTHALPFENPVYQAVANHARDAALRRACATKGCSPRFAMGSRVMRRHSMVGVNQLGKRY